MGYPQSFMPSVASLYGKTTSGNNPLQWGGPNMRWGSADPMQNMQYAQANLPGTPYAYQNTAQALYGTPWSTPGGPMQYGRWNWINPQGIPPNPGQPGTSPPVPPGTPPGPGGTTPPPGNPGQPGTTSPPGTTAPPPVYDPSVPPSISDGTFRTNAVPGGTIGGPTTRFKQIPVNPEYLRRHGG